MSSEIGISYEQMTTSAADLQKNADSIRSLLDEVTALINNNVGSGKTWDSEKGATALKERYSQLAAKYDTFYQKIVDYSKFLNTTVATYQASDAAASQAVGNNF